MSRRQFSRQDRVASQLKQELSLIVVNALKDPRVGFATITDLKLTRDYKYAKVFVSIYAEKEVRQEAIDALNNASGYLKKEIAKRLSLRVIPEFEFMVDNTLDNASRIENVLQAIDEGEKNEVAHGAMEYAKVSSDRSQLEEAKLKIMERNHQEKSLSGSKKNKKSQAILNAKFGIDE